MGGAAGRVRASAARPRDAHDRHGGHGGRPQGGGDQETHRGARRAEEEEQVGQADGLGLNTDLTKICNFPYIFSNRAETIYWVYIPLFRPQPKTTTATKPRN